MSCRGKHGFLKARRFPYIFQFQINPALPLLNQGKRLFKRWYPFSRKRGRKPASRIECAKLRKGIVTDGSLRPGDPFQVVVMEHYELSVLRHLYVQLNIIHADIQGTRKSRQRVLRENRGISPVCDNHWQPGLLYSPVLRRGRFLLCGALCLYCALCQGLLLLCGALCLFRLLLWDLLRHCILSGFRFPCRLAPHVNLPCRKSQNSCKENRRHGKARPIPLSFAEEKGIDGHDKHSQRKRGEKARILPRHHQPKRRGEHGQEKDNARPSHDEPHASLRP